MTKFRIQPAYNDRWTFERCDGRRTLTGGAEYWRVIATCDDKASAEKRLVEADYERAQDGVFAAMKEG